MILRPDLLHKAVVSSEFLLLLNFNFFPKRLNLKLSLELDPIPEQLIFDRLIVLVPIAQEFLLFGPTGFSEQVVELSSAPPLDHFGHI